MNQSCAGLGKGTTESLKISPKSDRYLQNSLTVANQAAPNQRPAVAFISKGLSDGPHFSGIQISGLKKQWHGHPAGFSMLGEPLLLRSVLFHRWASGLELIWLSGIGTRRSQVIP